MSAPVPTDKAVEAALHARVPGGSEVWHWINGGGMQVDDTHRSVMRTILEATASAEAGEPVGYFQEHPAGSWKQVPPSWSDLPNTRRLYALPPPDQVMAERVETWQCACGGKTYARVDAQGPDSRFKPGDWVRCINCKDVAFWPQSRERADRLEAALIEARNDLLGCGFVGPSPDGVGDPEINRIDTALNLSVKI